MYLALRADAQRAAWIENPATIPKAVSGYGSTEAGGRSHLARWSSDGEIAGDASRHGGAGRAGIEWRLSDSGEIQLRERERAAMFDGYVTADGLNDARNAEGWFDTGDLGRVENGNSLVFLERSSESTRVKGEFVPIPFVENHLAAVPGVADHALWKRKGELVDDEAVAGKVQRRRLADHPVVSWVELP